jgi:eukaryotic-like serine/threonine-protein kinase
MSAMMSRIGKYQVVAPLHMTDYSDIFVCSDTVLDVRVCVKIYSPKNGADGAASSGAEELRGRFLHEAKVMARMDHPHLVPIREYDHLEDGRPYIVMPFYPATLKYEIGFDATDLKRRRRLPPSRRPHAIAPGRAVRVLDQVFGALSALHEFGLVHRDVKPGNLFLSAKKNGAIKLGDFGMVKVPGLADVEAGKWIGTPNYMSPEQANDSAGVDPRADIFAAGVLAFRMLVGRLPENGEPFPEGAVKGCPKGLGALVDQYRAPNPDARPPDAATARKLLAAFH